MNGSRPAQRGIALMLVLWVVALLTIIALGLTATQRTETALAGNQLATMRFRAAADAGISWTVLKLLAPPTILDEEVEDWAPDGTARRWDFAGQRLEISVFNEASRIDLNTAPRDLLEALFEALGLAEDEASAAADAIEDWRDVNDLTELNGAEDGDYEDEGLSYGAKDAPFDSVEELQLVLGIDRDLYQALLPALTVDSGNSKMDSEFAPPLVKAALQGTSLEEIELEQQEEEALAETDGTGSVSLGRGGPNYRIRVTQLVEDQAGPTMEALVSIETGGTQPFQVLWKRFGLVLEPAEELGDERDREDTDF